MRWTRVATKTERPVARGRRGIQSRLGARIHTLRARLRLVGRGGTGGGGVGGRRWTSSNDLELFSMLGLGL